MQKAVKKSLGSVLALATIVLIALSLMAAQSSTSQGTTKGKGKAAGKSGAARTAAKHAYQPNEIKWGPPPPFVPAGAEVAVLEGNPMGTTGDFTIRIKAPDGYQIAPHWHPKRENVTIISGTLNVGMGDKFDESKMAGFSAGSFAYMDPSMHHYVKAVGETVVQVHGAAPLAFNYVNPSDDPSKKK